jgi:hypothetical protein
MNNAFSTEIRTIEAAAKLILDLCKDSSDRRLQLERISYAAAVVKRQADDGLRSLDKATEACRA